MPAPTSTTASSSSARCGGVVRDALELIAEQGLPGTPPLLHHLPHRPSGRRHRRRAARALSDRDDGGPAARVLGPRGLPERFGVTLSFGGVPQRLEVPFEAVRVFADPSVEFGLQFTVASAGAPKRAGAAWPAEPRCRAVAGAAKRPRPPRRADRDGRQRRGRHPRPVSQEIGAPPVPRSALRRRASRH